MKDIRQKYPDRVPVICNGTKNLKHKITNQKYLVPKETTLMEFLSKLRRTFKLDSTQGIYIAIDGDLPLLNSTFAELDDLYRHEEDGILYMDILQENVFG